MMSTIYFNTAATPIVEPGYHTGIVGDVHQLDDPNKGGPVIKILWSIKNHTVSDSLQVAHPDLQKRGFFQKKFRQILQALNLPPLPPAKEGEEVSYDLDLLQGRSCGLVVTHRDYNGQTYVNIKDYVTTASSPSAPVKAAPEWTPQVARDKDTDDGLPF